MDDYCTLPRLPLVIESMVRRIATREITKEGDTDRSFIAGARETETVVAYPDGQRGLVRVQSPKGTSAADHTHAWLMAVLDREMVDIY